MELLRRSLLPSLCPANDRTPQPVTVGLVQSRWYEDAALHRKKLADGVATAANAGASVVFLPELTLSRYPADSRPEGRADITAEPLEGGPTHAFASELAKENDVLVHASLFEYTGADDGRGLNTAIVVNTHGEICATTRKLHIPVTAGYHEDLYFAEGSDPSPYPIHRLPIDSAELAVGLPTCWDEWFPEVARSYGLGGADLLCYPTAIGSEPDYPTFDTAPLLRQVITGHAIANGLFIVVPNRFGNEGLLSFYGSSFVVDPFGRVLAEAPRDREAVLVVDIDISQRRDWLTLFPFYATRRPDTYQSLAESRKAGDPSEPGGIPGL